MQPGVQRSVSEGNATESRVFAVLPMNVRNGERAGNSLRGREALAKPAARQWGSAAPALPPPFDDRRFRRDRVVIQTQDRRFQIGDLLP